MPRRIRAILSGVAAVSALLACATAAAAECKGVSFPDHVQVQGATLALNGLGLRSVTFLKVSVYVAALYVDKPTHDARAILDSHAPSQIVLQFVRNVGVGDLRGRFEEGFAKNSPAELPALKERIARLDGFLSDVKSGERMVFVRLPGEGVQVELNDHVAHRIEGDDFGRALFAIWLGESPPNPELKAGLLGGRCG